MQGQTPPVGAHVLRCQWQAGLQFWLDASCHPCILLVNKGSCTAGGVCAVFLTHCLSVVVPLASTPKPDFFPNPAPKKGV
jgi:hypothetical protein